MHAEPPAQKPEVSFRTPTYLIGGSNFLLHGRAGLFGWFLIVSLLVRIIDTVKKESRRMSLSGVFARMVLTHRENDSSPGDSAYRIALRVPS